MLKVALLCALVSWGANALWLTAMVSAAQRPIVLAAIMGLLLGDLKTGIIMGASLEAVFLGVMVVGGVVPANSTIATIVSVSYVLTTGSDMTTGLAIAYPIGTIVGSFQSIWTQLQSLLEPLFQGWVDKGEIKKFERFHQFYAYFGMPIVNTVILFFAVLLGVNGLQAIIDKIPVFVMRGITSSSGMMTAIGLGITLNLIWSKELGAFFFIGFALFKFCGLSQLEVSIVAVSITILYFFLDQKISKKSDVVEENNGGDFF